MTEDACCEPGDCKSGRLRIGAVVLAAGKGARLGGREKGLIEIDGEPLKIPAILPKLSETPGRTDWPGAKIGAHNSEILGDLLGLSEADLSSLSDDGVTC